MTRPKQRRKSLNLFTSGANSDMPQERGTRGVPAVEISGFDTSPPAPNTRSLLQAQDGYTPLNFVPAQYNPDGQATGAKAGKVTYKAYKFAGQRGNMIAGICNGADSPSTSYGDAGKYRLVYTSLASTSPASEYGSQNTGGPSGYLVSQNILVRATYSATPSPQFTFFYLDKDTLAASSEVYSLSGIKSNPKLMCSDGMGSQFVRALYADSGESNKNKPSFFCVDTQEEPATFTSIGDSSFTWGYSGSPPEISSWFAKTDGTGLVASYTGYKDVTIENGRIFQISPSSQSNALAVTPIDATQLRTCFYAIAEGPDDCIISISIQPGIILFTSLIFTAGQWVTESTFPWTPNPASSSIPTFFAESFQRGPDGNYYAVLYTGNSASPSTQPRSLVKLSPSFGGGGTITSLPTPTIVYTFSDVYAGASLAILPDGRMCVVGVYAIGGGAVDYKVSFFSAAGALVSTLSFPSDPTDPYIAPTMVAPWKNDQFLVVGVRRTLSGSTLNYSPWGAFYSASGALVLSNDNTSPFVNANVPTSGGMFDPLGINSSIPL